MAPDQLVINLEKKMNINVDLILGVKINIKDDTQTHMYNMKIHY